MKEDILAKRYANAIYDISKEKNIAYDNLLKLLSIVEEEILKNEEVKKIIEYPNILNSNKLSIIKEILNNFNEEEINIVKYLFEKDRLKIVKEIKKELIEIYNEQNDIYDAIATFAISISDIQKDRLIKKLEKKYNKKINLKININPDILGGGIVEINGEKIDGSYKTQLEKMSKIF